MAPAITVIWVGLDPTRTLVMSQVVLSFGLPFAIIPLVMFTRNKTIMGEMANKPVTTAFAVLIAFIIITLNVYLLYQLLG